MKRNLLLLAVMILTVFAFSNVYADCPQAPNDHGNCDTLGMEVWPADVNFPMPTGYAKISLYVTHDTPADGDSLAAFVLPMCYTHNNPTKYCSVTAYQNAISWNPTLLARSIFRHLPDNTTATVHNWMMDLYDAAEDGQWNSVILDMDGTSHYWLSLIPTGTEDPRYGDPARRLMATMSFKLEDSMTVCVDTCFWPPSSRVAYTNASPSIAFIPRLAWQNADGVGQFCHDFFIIPNLPPELTCAGTQSQNQNGHYVIDGAVSVTDPDCPQGVSTLSSLSISFAGDGVTNVTLTHPNISGCADSSNITYDVTNHCAAGGVVTIIALDSKGGADTCFFGINLTNHAPTIACPGNQTIYVPGGVYNGSATGTDPDGDAITYSGDPANPAWVTVGSGGAIHATPDVGDTGVYTVCVIGTDVCQATSRCCFDIEVKAIVGVPNHVYIPVTPCVDPGHYVDVPIYMENFQPGVCFGGFELEVEFDYTSMTFVSADPGALLLQPYTEVVGSDTTFYSWEYFNYRMLPCPLCACCKYKILLFGMKDLPNGPFHKGYDICPTDPMGELAVLHFVVNNDEKLRGLMIPICFEWEGEVVEGQVVHDWDCAENTFSDPTGNILYVSNKECEYMPLPECDTPGSIERLINFMTGPGGDCGVCGGVMVCNPSGGQCKRGDVNYNTMPYEPADAVLFARYFAEGIGVFGPEPDRSLKVCATDVNADGRTLTLSDLVYLIRVILHDAVEIPKLAPATVANVVVSNGVITVAGANVGAILFEFDGAVNPTLLASGMDMAAGTNKVLVYMDPTTGQSLASASEVISYTGDAKLVSVEAVDRDTRVLTTTITSKIAPTTFALHAAYPNPFNPNTNLSFTLPEAVNYSLKIYNVAGQLVRAYEGSGSTGLNVITWDGKDNAGNSVSSGVYFYKLVAGHFSATEKMVMMK
jgi:hypothetical protein